jgi:hypothetical protein
MAPKATKTTKAMKTMKKPAAGTGTSSGTGASSSGTGASSSGTSPSTPPQLGDEVAAPSTPPQLGDEVPVTPPMPDGSPPAGSTAVGASAAAPLTPECIVRGLEESTGSGDVRRYRLIGKSSPGVSLVVRDDDNGSAPDLHLVVNKGTPVQSIQMATAAARGNRDGLYRLHVGGLADFIGWWKSVGDLGLEDGSVLFANECEWEQSSSSSPSSPSSSSAERGDAEEPEHGDD